MPGSVIAISELRYRRLFEAAHDGILIMDPATRKIIDVNPFMVQFLGYPAAWFIGKELFEIGLLSDEAASQEAFHELQKSGFIRYEDLPLKTSGGQLVDVEFVSNIYDEGDHQVIQCNIRDISARKKQDDERLAASVRQVRHAAELEFLVNVRTAELQRSNAQLETFVYSIAHDLRAPLRTMQGFASLLVEDHGAQLNAQGREYATYIKSAAQTMDQLLSDLLAFSHLSQQKIEQIPVELRTALVEALAACAPEIGRRGTLIENRPPWPVVLAHPATLRQVLVNLIGNALKFTTSTEPQVRIWSEPRPEHLVRIWVEDNGIGIPLASQQRIFQVFQRLHTTQYEGTGIGLAIVQKGVERMSGQVGVISAPGAGSKFWVELPQPPAAPKNL
jgi:PAS domain S-box-containing protein